MNADRLKLADPHDRDWQALRYVLDEMSSAENEAFEELLQHDQDAREAVARCVELIASVRASAHPVLGGAPRAALIPAPPSMPKRPSQRVPLRLASLAAACAVAAGLWFSVSQFSKNIWIGPAGDPAENGAGQLISFWLDWLSDPAAESTGAEGTLTERPEVAQSHRDEIAADLEVADASEDSAGDENRTVKENEETVPGWMIAAVLVGEGKPFGRDGSVEFREN